MLYFARITMWLNFYRTLIKSCLVLLQVQERFEVDIKELPEQIDTSTYSMSYKSFITSYDSHVCFTSSLDNFLSAYCISRLTFILRPTTSPS